MQDTRYKFGDTSCILVSSFIFSFDLYSKGICRMIQKEGEGITNTNDFLGAVEARARHRGYEIGSRYARNALRCSGVGEI